MFVLLTYVVLASSIKFASLLTYLASPYSHCDPAVREARYQLAVLVSAELIKRGLLVYSPIVHCHPIGLALDAPADFNTWSAHCLHMLSKADKMIVLKADGWEKSKGVNAEIQWAVLNKIPVHYFDIKRGIISIER